MIFKLVWYFNGFFQGLTVIKRYKNALPV